METQEKSERVGKVAEIIQDRKLELHFGKERETKILDTWERAKVSE